MWNEEENKREECIWFERKWFVVSATGHEEALVKTTREFS